MYFFDSEFLKQYLDQGVALQVYVDSEYYDIADVSDLENPTFGIGYNLNGKPHTFDYRSIQQIKAGSNILTSDQLQDKISGTEGGEAEPDSGDAEQPPELESPETVGAGAPSDVGGEPQGEPQPDGVNPQGGEPPNPEDEEEPPSESVMSRMIVGSILSEAKAKKDTSICGFVKGDLVENVDLKCEYCGSRGCVTNVDMPDNKDGIATVEYRVFNYGFNFKPGQKVIKLATQLQKMGE